MDKFAGKVIELAGKDASEISGETQEEIFAECFKACERTLKITPYEVQLSAARALAEGKIVQMQTGEGKTLAAVFAAVFLAKKGHKVHVLTFNDYLAQRDYNWMKPIYDEMGVSVGVIEEKTPREERKEQYSRQVLYITAKEAGFDYLRDFVETQTEKACFPGFDCAIFDEADSLLIDEARIPLIIAGDVEVRESGDTARIFEQVRDFGEDCFEIDEETRNVYLTDEGADRAEALFGEIYSEENAPVLARICACLKAREVLKEDKDYIVKDGKIVLVDEFTGRTAPGRVFPGELQAACEAKHGLKITSRGRIIGSIAVQYFARMYPRIAGMTGTAQSAAEEFDKMYGMAAEIIPTRLPCRRIDKAAELYFDEEEKTRAVCEAVKEAHDKERPVLVGTKSVEESEKLAGMLADMGIKCAVLNAKNNFEEAKIIANAGKRGAVTISTNMAGRGVDIKLGGEDAEEKELVEKAGGLLVIASSMRESARIIQQLRGRAGRQGDAGESRFMASLEDEILTKNNLKSFCGKHYPSGKAKGRLEDKVLLREAERMQRMSENDAFSERDRLMKYTLIGEKHRAMTFEKRTALLEGRSDAEMWKKNAPEEYEKAVKKFGEDKVRALENRVLAVLLNEFHSDYLDYTAYLREGIHLTQIAGRNPADEYNIACEEYYESAAASIPERMCEKLEDVLRCGKIEEYKLEVPTKIYTYLLNDMAQEIKAKPILLGFFDDEAEEAEEKKAKPEKSEKTGFFGKFRKKS